MGIRITPFGPIYFQTQEREPREIVDVDYVDISDKDDTETARKKVLPQETENKKQKKN